MGKIAWSAISSVTPTFFSLLRNHTGEFVDADYSYKLTREMAVVCILVLLDLREGLALEVCLNMEYGDVNQILDYEGVPFHCHRCHSVAHLVAQCDRPFSGKLWTTGRKEWVREEVITTKKSKGSYTGYGSPIPSST